MICIFGIRELLKRMDSETAVEYLKKHGWRRIERKRKDIAVLQKETYGDIAGTDLEVLTHRELPWIEARGDAKPFQHCTTPISTETMAKYYKSIYHGDE